jgi:hypothetical protein
LYSEGAFVGLLRDKYRESERERTALVSGYAAGGESEKE